MKDDFWLVAELNDIGQWMLDYQGPGGKKLADRATKKIEKALADFEAGKLTTERHTKNLKARIKREWINCPDMRAEIFGNYEGVESLADFFDDLIKASKVKKPAKKK